MRKTVFRIAYLFRLHRIFRLKNSEPIIVCFHRISPEHSPGYPPQKPEVFERLLTYLTKHTEIVDFDDLERKTLKPKCIITFDDAYADFKEHALPIIKKHQIPVTLNVISHCAETGEPPWTQKINDLMEVFVRQNRLPQSTLNVNINSTLNEEQLALEFYKALKGCSLAEINHVIAELENQINLSGFSYTRMLRWDEIKKILNEYPKLRIGNHTKYHRNLFGDIADDDLRQDVFESENEINQNLGIKTSRFAFPNGQANQKSIDLVVQAGYAYIQLTDHSFHFKQEKVFFRTEPNCLSFDENIFKLHGFHRFIKTKLSKS